MNAGKFKCQGVNIYQLHILNFLIKQAGRGNLNER
jgi:hypothetical protein